METELLRFELIRICLSVLTPKLPLILIHTATDSMWRVCFVHVLHVSVLCSSVICCSVSLQTLWVDTDCHVWWCKVLHFIFFTHLAFQLVCRQNSRHCFMMYSTAAVFVEWCDHLVLTCRHIHYEWTLTPVNTQRC